MEESKQDIENESESSDDDIHETQIEFENKIDPNKWYGLFRGYIRKDYYEDELRASWIELFYDLIFVACIVHLAYEGVHSIDTDSSHRRLANNTYTTTTHHCGQYEFLLTVFAQFGLFNALWLEQVMYITHFLFNQCMDEYIRVSYMTMILSMGLFVGNDPAYHMGFIISYAILRFLSLFMYLKALLIPRAKWHAIWHLSLYFTIFIVALILIICMFVYWVHMYSQCALTYCFIYISLFCLEYGGRMSRLLLSRTLTPDIKLSMNIPHIAERYGLFVMIIIGESLISLMTANLGKLDLHEPFAFEIGHGVPPDFIQILFILITFILSYLIGRLYYNCQPSDEQIMSNKTNHALGRTNRIYARIYQLAHQVLFFGLFGYGVGVKIVASHLLDEKRRMIDVLVPGYSLVLIVVSLNVIRIAHPFKKIFVKRVWIQRVLIIICMAWIPTFGHFANQGVLLMITFVCVIMLVVIDVEGEHMVKQQKVEAKEKREESAGADHGKSDNEHDVLIGK